jgi:hypothetical protein
MALLRNTTLLILGILSLFPTSSVASEASTTYSSVRIAPRNPDDLITLLKGGLALDHVGNASPSSFDVILSQSELAILHSSGVPFEVLVHDMIAEYDSRPILSPEQRNALEASMKAQYPVSRFEFGSMGGYYTFDEVVRELDSARTQFPNLVTVKQSIGTSIQGRNLWMVKISDNADVDEDELEVLYTGLHHAREPQSMACLMYFIYFLLENYGTDPDATFLVDNRELYFIPVVNPDGYVYNQTTNPNGGGLWRKNRRANAGGSFGVDLNRNYGYQWGYDNIGSSNIPTSETYRGTTAFSEPETQTIRDFAVNHNFMSCLNYHSYSNLLIYPWGYISNFVTSDSALYIGLADDMTQFNNYTYGTANQTVGYLVNGEANDWMYGEQTTKDKILAMTPEVGGGSDGFWPNTSRIFPLAEENLYPNIQIAYGPSAIFTTGLSLSSSSGNGTFSYTMTVTNTSVIRQNVSIVVTVTGPNGFNATIFNRTQRINPGASFIRTRNYSIRNGALGDYTVTMSVTGGGFALGSDAEVYSKTSVMASKTGMSNQDVPEEPTLDGNYPNPFNPSTTIRYTLDQSGHVSLKIYDVLGQEIRTLVDGYQDPGDKAVVWNGNDNAGKPVSSGVYMYRIQTDDLIKTARMVLSK